NRKSESIAVDLYLQGQKGSRLSANLAALSKTPSLFGSLAQPDAAFRFLVNVRLPWELRQMLPALVNEATRQTLRDATAEDRRKHEPLFRTLGETFAAGELDGVVVVRSRGEGKPASVEGGLKVPNGAALDKLLRDLVAELPDKAVRDLFEMEAEDFGGVKAHRFRAQQYFTDTPRKVFGDNPFYYAFRSDALFYAAGDRSKQTLADALPSRPKESPLALLTVNLRQLNQLLRLQSEDAPLPREQFTRAHPGRIRLELAGGDSLRFMWASNWPSCGFSSLDWINFLSGSRRSRARGQSPARPQRQQGK